MAVWSGGARIPGADSTYSTDPRGANSRLAAGMPQPQGVDNYERGDIKALYFGARVLVTGASGFVGKVLIESLLRKTEVDKVYVLIRSKRNKAPEERLKEILNEEIFENLKKAKPERLSAIVPVRGDLAHPTLDLFPGDVELLAKDVDVVFHIAATVRFNENLKLAAEINLRGTKLVMDLARRMEKLKVIIHCSTAYALDFLDEIEEKIYPAEEIDLIKLAEAVSKETAHKITKELIGKSRNTYVYTKHLAEYLIDRDYRDLPVGIVRPGMVASAVTDPLPGYIDNRYGPTGILIEIMKGRLHCFGASDSGMAQLVPVDFTANALIATAWDTFHRCKNKTEIPVYNVVPAKVAPLRWGEFMEEFLQNGRREAPSSSSWYPFYFPATTFRQVLLISFIFHRIPGVFIDFVRKHRGKEPGLVKAAMLFEKTMQLLITFSSHAWVFHTDNVSSLWKKMGKEEQELFPFSFEGFNWKSYIEIYIKGMKQFLMKETISRKESQQRARRHLIHHWCLVSLPFMSCILYSLLYYTTNICFKL